MEGLISAAVTLAAAAPPRVLFVIGGLGTGGSEGQLVELLSRTHPHRLGAQVVALHPSSDERHIARLRQLGLDPRVMSQPEGPRPVRLAISLRRLVSTLTRSRPEVVYTWLEESTLLAAPVARALGIPVVVARRNISGAQIERYAPFGAAIPWAERLAEVVTANSLAVLEGARARGIEDSRLRLVRNGHPPRPALPWPEGSVTAIGYLARFRHEKGHFRLLRALERLRARSDWHVELGGDGPLLPDVVREAERLGLSDRVTFSGRSDDVRAFWARQHLAVLLSDHEGCPNALIEAAVAGRPIVATEVGGIPEVVLPRAGTVVPHDNPKAAAAAIARFIDDRTLCRAVGEAARAQALERFAIESFVEGHMEALQAAQAGGRARGRRSVDARSR